MSTFSLLHARNIYVMLIQTIIKVKTSVNVCISVMRLLYIKLTRLSEDFAGDELCSLEASQRYYVPTILISIAQQGYKFL